LAPTKIVISGFYFELFQIGTSMVRIGALVTPEKPNITSKPVPDEEARILCVE